MSIHVVGAGIAGMVAALALARAGHAVTLHEAAPVAGGRCRALPDGTDGVMGSDHFAVMNPDDVGPAAGAPP